MKHVFGFRSGRGTYTGVTFGSDCSIIGAPKVSESDLLGGTITGTPEISDSVIDGNAIISDNCKIFNSIVRGNCVIGDRSFVGESKIVNNSIVSGSARVIGSTMKDYSVATGEAIVYNTTLFGYAFVDSGTWRRPPITFIMEGGWVINEGVDDLIRISCITAAADRWHKLGPRYGRMLGFSEKEVAEIKDYVSAIQSIKKENAKQL